jgi:hypothetical protein
MSTFSTPTDLVFDEFKLQFSREFECDITKYEQESERFNTEDALHAVIPLLESLEIRFPILDYWRRR